jgi:hypothetical protein
MRRGLWTIGGALVLAASACGSSSHPHADPSTTASARPVSPVATTARPPTTPLPTTSTTVPDPAVVPPAIDASYVNAVLAQLNHVYGNAQRIEISTKLLPPSIPPLLRAIYGDQQLTRELYVFSQALQGSTLEDANANAGDPVMTTTELTARRNDCIQASVIVDDSSASPQSQPLPLFIVLRPKVSSDDPRSVNTTPWQITYQMSTAPSGSDAC